MIYSLKYLICKANSNQKKVAVNNKKSIKILQFGNLIAVLVHVLSNYILKRDKYFSTTSLVLTTPGIICSILLTRWGSSTYSNNGQLVSSGEDINTEGGLIEHIWDIGWCYLFKLSNLLLI